jgi:hypothetical protein
MVKAAEVMNRHKCCYLKSSRRICLYIPSSTRFVNEGGCLYSWYVYEHEDKVAMRQWQVSWGNQSNGGSVKTRSFVIMWKISRPAGLSCYYEICSYEVVMMTIAAHALFPSLRYDTIPTPQSYIHDTNIRTCSMPLDTSGTPRATVWRRLQTRELPLKPSIR